MSNTHKSDLIDCVQHEHLHLQRLFDDLRQTFERIAHGEYTPAEDVLESAAEELAVALDEMLHHFNQEEEVFFVDIEQRFPELSNDIASLVAGHEFMCERTQWLQKQLNKTASEIADEINDILQVVSEIHRSIIQHTVDEQRVFGEVLDKIPLEERDKLLREMQAI